MRMRMRMRMRDSASIKCLIRRNFDRLNKLYFSWGHENGAFFQESVFSFLVFQPGIAAVLHGVRPKCVFTFRQANTLQNLKTP